MNIYTSSELASKNEGDMRCGPEARVRVYQYERKN